MTNGDSNGALAAIAVASRNHIAVTERDMDSGQRAQATTQATPYKRGR
jgi:hypothetical protein